MARERDPLPWTRFNYRDFFDDPAVIRLGDHRIGTLMRLFMAAWESPRQGWKPGHIPDDDAYLAHVARLDPRVWEGCRDEFARTFKVVDGWWVQSRIVREYQNADRAAAEKSTKASRAATTRWDARALPEHSERNAGAMLGDARLKTLDVRLKTESNPPVGPPSSERPEQAGQPEQPARKRAPRRKAPPNLEISPEQIDTAAARFKLSRETVALLAERVVTEAPQRGYVNAYSALLSWCRREQQNPTPAPASGAPRALVWYDIEPEVRTALMPLCLPDNYLRELLGRCRNRHAAQPFKSAAVAASIAVSIAEKEHAA